MFWLTYIAYLTQDKKNCSSKIQKETKNSLEKEMIFRKKLLWTRRWQLWEPWKIFSEEKTPIFSAPSPNKKETMCKVLNIFFLKVFQGYVG